VSGIAFSGNRALHDFVLATRIGQPFSESLLGLDRRAILDRYAELGFFWAGLRFESTRAGEKGASSHKVAVLFRVTEGERARIGRVGLHGNRMVAAAKLRAQLPCGSGFFAAPGMKRNIKSLLGFYADNGFPFCSIRPDSMALTGRSVFYVLLIDEGSEVRLSDVRFSGQTETRPELLKRLLGLRLDAPYSESRTRQRIARLAADPLLAVQGYELRQAGAGSHTEGRFWLEVKLDERKSSRIAGAIAYSPEDNELAGTANAGFDNLFGTRRAADLNWQKSPGRQDLSFSYTEPWLLGTRISLTPSVQNRLRDSSYSSTELLVTGTAGIAEGLFLRLGSGYSLAASALRDLPSSRTYWVNSGLEFDTRDQRSNPARGILANLAIRAGSRLPDTLARQTLAKTDIDVVWFLPLRWRLSLALLGHGRDVFSPDTVYAYDRFELGGASSLRGYREGQFSTGRCAWVNGELRYLAGRTARIYPFFDLAVVQNPESGSDEWHSGYGAGIRIGTAIGLVGVDYGVRTGASPLRGKVHFSVQASF
jgi:outer membrane protein assembly factor BamA